MGKLNKVLAMSLAVLTLAGSSSQVFATRLRRSSSLKSRKSDSQRLTRRNSGGIDYAPQAKTVKDWYKRLENKIGENGQFGSRTYGTAPTSKEINAARALVFKRGKKVSGFLEASVMLYHERKIRANDATINEIDEEAKKISKGNFLGKKKEVFDLIHNNFHAIVQPLNSGYLSKDTKKTAQKLLDFYNGERENSREIVTKFTNDIIDKAREEYPYEDVAVAIKKLINRLIHLKILSPAEIKIHVDRMVKLGLDLSFLDEIKRYVDESKKIQAEALAARYRNSSKFRKSK